MAAIIGPTYGTEVTVTLSADGIASGAARKSTKVTLSGIGGLTGTIDNAWIRVQLNTATGTLGSPAYARLWVAIPSVGGTNYTDGVTDGDAAYTMLTNPTMAVLYLPIDTANVTKYFSGKHLVALLGDIPDSVVFVLENQSGLAFAGTAGQSTQCKVTLLPMQYQSQ